VFGLGDNKPSIAVYIGNRPPLMEFERLSDVVPLKRGDVRDIGLQTGNGWRKVFNVYAKVLFELNANHCSTWQQLRDDCLLQPGCGHALLFSEFQTEPDIDVSACGVVHIITGRTYALEHCKTGHLEWLNKDFAVNRSQRLIVCPYFDYRQLSNIKILQLVSLVQSFLNSDVS